MTSEIFENLRLKLYRAVCGHQVGGQGCSLISNGLPELHIIINRLGWINWAGGGLGLGGWPVCHVIFNITAPPPATSLAATQTSRHQLGSYLKHLCYNQPTVPYDLCALVAPFSVIVRTLLKVCFQL